MLQMKYVLLKRSISTTENPPFWMSASLVETEGRPPRGKA